MITRQSLHTERRRVMAVLFTLVIVAGFWVLLGFVSFPLEKTDREKVPPITKDNLIRLPLDPPKPEPPKKPTIPQPEPQPSEPSSTAPMPETVSVPEDLLEGARAEAAPAPTPVRQPAPAASRQTLVQKTRVEERLLAADETPSLDATFQFSPPGSESDGISSVGRTNGTREGTATRDGEGPEVDGVGPGVMGKERKPGDGHGGIQKQGSRPGPDDGTGPSPSERAAQWVRLNKEPLPVAIRQLMKAEQVGAYIAAHDVFQPPGEQSFDIYLMCVGCDEKAGRYMFHIVLVGKADPQAIYLVGNGDFSGSIATMFRYGPAQRDAAGVILHVNTSNRADASRGAAYSKIFKAWWNTQINK